MMMTKTSRPSARRVALGLLLLLLLLITGLWRNAFVLALLLLPASVFASWVLRQQQNHGVTDRELKQLLLFFLGGIFPSTLLALVAQSALVPFWTVLCFYDQRESINSQLQSYLNATEPVEGSGSLAMAVPHAPRLAELVQQLHVDKTIGYFVFLLAMAFVVAALVEEFLKLWLVQGSWNCCYSSAAPKTNVIVGSRRSSLSNQSSRLWLCSPQRLLYHPQRHSNHSFVVFMAVVAGALGFSFAENVGYTFAVPDFQDRVAAALLRSAISTSLHCVCGGITGVRLATRLQQARRVGSGGLSPNASAMAQLSTCRGKLTMLLPAILVHGTFDLQAFLLAALVPQEAIDKHPWGYGLALPLGVAFGIVVASAYYMRRILHGMEQRMHEGRYIQVAVDLESGQRTSILSDEEEDDDQDDDLDQEFGERKARRVFNI